MKRLIIYIISFISILFFNYNIIMAEDLSLSGESYILIEEDSGRVLAAKNPHKKMPMASTTKIMTTIVALEKGNLKDRVEIDGDSINIEGSSIYLKDKEVILLEDLLYGLMMRSGNDSAMAISKHISGDEDKFVKLMNAKANSIGANNTNFKNPHGLDDRDHYSTAYDLALITREGFKDKSFEKIVSTKTYTAKREKENYFLNKNKTLWEYENGDGVKTGYTMRSGRCLVSSAKRNNMRLIAVSLNARDWFNDNYKLFDYGFENYKNHLIFDKNQFLKTIPVINGTEDLKVVTKEDFIYPLDNEEKKQIKFQINLDNNITPPINKGDVVGNINVYLNGVLIKTDTLISDNNVKKTNFIQRLFKKETI